MFLCTQVFGEGCDQMGSRRFAHWDDLRGVSVRTAHIIELLDPCCQLYECPKVCRFLLRRPRATALNGVVGVRSALSRCRRVCLGGGHVGQRTANPVSELHPANAGKRASSASWALHSGCRTRAHRGVPAVVCDKHASNVRGPPRISC